jgi:cardiolipin synthase
VDFLSMEWLEEGALVVDDPRFASAFDERWRHDLTRSRQVAGRRDAAAGEPPRREAVGGGMA